MPPAARVTDMTMHPGYPPGSITGPGVPNVLIGGLPAAVLGDLHACPMPPPPVGIGPHPPNPIAKGSATVLIGGRPAARIMDITACGAQIMPPGAVTVMIGG